MPTGFTDLPLDVLPPILECLSDRRDWHACALVNRSFTEVATPLLYRTLDSRVKGRRLLHPSATLISHPELAKHVRHVTETGSVHFGHQHRQQNITRDTLHALSLCTNLHSLTWTDDHSSPSYVSFAIPFFVNNSEHSPPPGRTFNQAAGRLRSSDSSQPNQAHPLLLFLSVIKASCAPLREITIRSNNDLGTSVWFELSRLTGLTKIGIWCMEGPPRVLQGWAGRELGETLVELELGRCAGVPPTILNSVLSQLPLLQDLHIKGVQAAAVLTILTLLPALRTLDTEYLISESGNILPRGWRLELISSSFPSSSPPSPSTLLSQGGSHGEGYDDIRLPTLRNLTVRASSIDTMGPNKLFPWIRTLASNKGLETFRLLTFTTNGNIVIPRGFTLDMAHLHGDMCDGGVSTTSKGAGSLDDGDGTPRGNGRNGSRRTGLKRWIVTEAQMTLEDIACVCGTFPDLEELSCSTAVTVDNVESIKEAISSARNLRTLRLHIQWIPSQRQWRRPRQHHSQRDWKRPSSTSTLSHDRSRSRSSTPSSETVEGSGSESIHGEDTESDEENNAQVVDPNGSSDDTDQRWVFALSEIALRYATRGNHRDGRGGRGRGGSGGFRHSHCEVEDSPAVSFNLKNGGGMNISERRRWRKKPFTLEHAREMMLSEESKLLRVVAIGGVVYTGKWVWDGEEKTRRFEVEDAQEE